MGMDVKGIKPTTEDGIYFRASCWSWRPIESLLRMTEFAARRTADNQGLTGAQRQTVVVHWPGMTREELDGDYEYVEPAYFSNEQFRFLGSNDGAGTRTPGATISLAQSFKGLVACIAARDPGTIQLLRGGGLVVIAGDTPDSPLQVAFEIPRTPEPYECLVDKTGTFRKRGEVPLDDLYSAHVTDLSHLEDWVKFLEGAGDGFEIH